MLPKRRGNRCLGTASRDPPGCAWLGGAAIAWVNSDDRLASPRRAPRGPALSGFEGALRARALPTLVPQKKQRRREACRRRAPRTPPGSPAPL